MTAKSKDTATKKPLTQVLRPSISNSSLNYVPDDAVEGFQERIETGISWTITEEAARYHKQKFTLKNISHVTFSEALQTRINKSILNGFLNENSNFTLKEQWEILLSMSLWDNEKFSNDEAKKCFHSNNSLTDDMIELIKTAVQRNDREVLKRNLKMISVLRVNDSEMTDLDDTLKKFKNLTTLNLCGNYIVELNADSFPRGLRLLELQNNRISNVEIFTEQLPPNLIYLGLARNLLSNENVSGLSKLSHNITVLDLSDNDIYDLEVVLTALSVLPALTALQLAGNPCAVCAAYARTTITRLPQLQWLDCREILPTDKPIEPYEPHVDDLRSAYFNFTVFRIMSVPQPPKPDKGAITAFHVELELPLLDSTRRKFLMFRNNDSLVEMLPPPEDEEWPSAKLTPSFAESKMALESSGLRASSVYHESDIYNRLVGKNSREICHFTVFESNRVQWNKIMNFQEPTVKIFCPNLFALRDTFRTTITVRLVYTVTVIGKQSKSDKKSAQSLRPPGEQRVTLASIKCALRRADWSQPSQHFHWDDSLGTDEAIHWGDGDLSVLQYTLAAVKTPKGKPDSDPGSTKQFPPENLTCHFGFGIDTLRV